MLSACSAAAAAAGAACACVTQQSENFQELYAAFREALKVTEEDIDSFAVSFSNSSSNGSGICCSSSSVSSIDSFTVRFTQEGAAAQCQPSSLKHNQDWLQARLSGPCAQKPCWKLQSCSQQQWRQHSCLLHSTSLQHW
jgi:hypothetical protein